MTLRHILIVFTLLAVPPRSAMAQGSRLTLTYLANMGVLLESGGRRIVIDGFHHGALAESAALPTELLEPLERARDPFRALDLIARLRLRQ